MAPWSGTPLWFGVPGAVSAASGIAETHQLSEGVTSDENSPALARSNDHELRLVRSFVLSTQDRIDSVRRAAQHSGDLRSSQEQGGADKRVGIEPERTFRASSAGGFAGHWYSEGRTVLCDGLVQDHAV